MYYKTYLKKRLVGLDWIGGFIKRGSHTIELAEWWCNNNNNVRCDLFSSFLHSFIVQNNFDKYNICLPSFSLFYRDRLHATNTIQIASFDFLVVNHREAESKHSTGITRINDTIIQHACRSVIHIRFTFYQRLEHLFSG